MSDFANGACLDLFLQQVGMSTDWLQRMVFLLPVEFVIFGKLLRTLNLRQVVSYHLTSVEFGLVILFN